MAAGTAVHAALEYAMRRKMEGLPIDTAVMELVASKELTREWKRVPLLDFNKPFGDDSRIKAAGLKVERCTKVVHKLLVPLLNPLAAETQVEFDYSKEVVLNGRIDVVHSALDGTLWIRDLKVGGDRTPDKDSADKSGQLVFYAIMYEKMTGRKVHGGVLDHLVDSKRPHFTPRSVVFTEERRAAIWLKVERTVQAIAAGVYTPGHEYFMCNEGRCEMYSNCEMGAGRKVEEQIVH